MLKLQPACDGFALRRDGLVGVLQAEFGKHHMSEATAQLARILLAVQAHINPEQRSNKWTVCLTSKGVIAYLNKRISPLGAHALSWPMPQNTLSDCKYSLMVAPGKAPAPLTSMHLGRPSACLGVRDARGVHAASSACHNLSAGCLICQVQCAARYALTAGIRAALQACACSGRCRRCCPALPAAPRTLLPHSLPQRMKPRRVARLWRGAQAQDRRWALRCPWRWRRWCSALLLTLNQTLAPTLLPASALRPGG